MFGSFGSFMTPGHVEYLNEHRAIIARYKKLIKEADSMADAKQLRTEQAAELAKLDEKFKNKE